jgi:hypothetical protein
VRPRTHLKPLRDPLQRHRRLRSQFAPSGLSPGRPCVARPNRPPSSLVAVAGFSLCARRAPGQLRAVLAHNGLLFGPEQPCAHWIEVDVIANALEIAIAAAIDDEGFVTPGKHMAEFPVATVKAAGAGAQQPLHASHKVGAAASRRPDESDWASEGLSPLISLPSEKCQRAL